MSDVTETDAEAVNDDAVDDTVDDDTGNRVLGASARTVLTYLARQIVDEPDSVVIEADEDPNRKRVDLRLHVAPDDMGIVIGRRGRTAQAIRAVVRAAGAGEGVEATVDIVD